MVLRKTQFSIKAESVGARLKLQRSDKQARRCRDHANRSGRRIGRVGEEPYRPAAVVCGTEGRQNHDVAQSGC